MNTASSKPPKYLVCVDGRPESWLALKLVSAKARAYQGRISLIHVIPPFDFQALHAVADRMEEKQRSEAEALMQHLAADVFALSGVTPTVMLREGTIGEEILAAVAEDTDATMLVVAVAAESGRGKLTGWLASQLGHKLFIPLLLVPGNLTEEQLAALI